MKTLLAAITCSLFLFNSCKKDEGEGGNSSIRGDVWVRDYNGTFTTLNGEYPGADAEVYILYGDELAVGDRIRANHEGKFEFKYLRPGNYKIYCYSKDSTMTAPSGQVAVIKEVEVGKKETVEAGRITIYE